MEVQPPAGVSGEENLSESLEKLKMRLETMKRIMESQSDDEEKGRMRRRRCGGESIIDGSLLSFVFIVVLILIIVVSAYAFYNLYQAVLKKFPPNHPEF